jgi:hypothetical protein
MPRAFLVVALLAVTAVGCGHNIGDSCNSNVDCDPTGLRFCDISAPSGYCTIDGCDVGTCPDEATCVRFFTVVLSEPCDHSMPPLMNGCRVDEFCVCDATDDGGHCIVPDVTPPMVDEMHAHCAPETTERRWCQKKCGGDGDCRAGYSCRSTGTAGAEPVPTVDMLSGVPAKFCAPGT